MDFPVSSFLRRHLTTQISQPSADLTGKCCIVTGGNAGLGYETVLHFTRRNAARIIIAGRSSERCQAAASKVKMDVPDYTGTVSTMQLDLASFASVRKFAEEVNQMQDKVDVAVLNAGILQNEYRSTDDGYEATLQTNVLATGLLAILLLPKLQASKTASSAPHLTIIASDVHYWAKFPARLADGAILDALNSKTSWPGGPARYHDSKLMDVLMARKIAALPAAQGIVVNSANPGLCASEFRRDMPWIANFISNKIAWSAEFGTRNFVIAATTDTKPGAFISWGEEATPAKLVVAEDGETWRQKLWAEEVELWKALSPEAAKILSM